jgi:hypothetical protein
MQQVGFIEGGINEEKSCGERSILKLKRRRGS